MRPLAVPSPALREVSGIVVATGSPSAAEKYTNHALTLCAFISEGFRLTVYLLKVVRCDIRSRY